MGWVSANVSKIVLPFGRDIYRLQTINFWAVSVVNYLRMNLVFGRLVVAYAHQNFERIYNEYFYNLAIYLRSYSKIFPKLISLKNYNLRKNR